MRRSRRSLVLLLASMALSLVVVRATSAPARHTRAAANKTAKNEMGSPRLVVAQAENTPAPSAPLSETFLAPRAVSATCIIVVLPRMAMSDRPAPLTGWSGCTAYANGCDHLGRTIPNSYSTQTRWMDHLIVAALKRVVKLATRISADASTALRQPEPFSERHRSAANDRPATRPEPAARQIRALDMRL